MKNDESQKRKTAAQMIAQIRSINKDNERQIDASIDAFLKQGKSDKDKNTELYGEPPDQKNIAATFADAIKDLPVVSIIGMDRKKRLMIRSGKLIS